MITVCMSCKCLFLKARFEGIEKNRNGTARSNHKQLKTFSKITREDMCNTSIGVCCVSLVMTFESCTHKLQQYFLVRTKNRSFDRVCLWGATSWGFWLELLLGNSFHPHITITSPPLFKCEITSAPRKVRIFLCQNKRKCWFHPTTVGKIARFSFFFDDWMIFAFLSVCFVDEKLFWSRNILTNGSIFLFSVDKIQKKQTFSSLFFDFTCRVVFPLHSFFVLKNNSSFVLFFVLVVPKKRKKNALKERLKLLFVQVFFFSQQETNQKKQS